MSYDARFSQRARPKSQMRFQRVNSAGAARQGCVRLSLAESCKSRGKDENVRRPRPFGTLIGSYGRGVVAPRYSAAFRTHVTE